MVPDGFAPSIDASTTRTGGYSSASSQSRTASPKSSSCSKGFEARLELSVRPLKTHTATRGKKEQKISHRANGTGKTPPKAARNRHKDPQTKKDEP